MAKYILAFMVLVLLALENNFIYKRLHVESLPSTRNDATIASASAGTHTRHHQRHYNRHHYSYHQQHLNSPRVNHRSRHKRQHHEHQNHHPDSNRNQIPPESQNSLKHQTNIKSSIENDAYLEEHLRRHQQHQLEHLRHHQEHYERRTRSSSKMTSEEHMNLRSMPRPWHYLIKADDEYMFGDEPNDDNDDDNDSSYFESKGRDVAFLKQESGESPAVPFDSPEDEGFNDIHSFESSSSEKAHESITDPEINSHEKEMKNHKKSGCPKCEVQRQVEHITEEELTRLRIEFVKNQILEKLRLKERPKVAAVSLPKPIQEGVTIDQGDEQSKNKDLDDYYARTSKKFIFLERETRECERTGVNPSICFSFKIDDADADGFDVNTAVLWIFKNKLKNKPPAQLNNTNTLINKETIVVSEVQQPVDLKFKPISKTVAIQTVTVQDKWLEIDIEWPIKRWFGNHDLSHLIQISCESCDISTIEDMISVDKDYRPFIMIDTQNRRRVSRQKRGINCTDGVTECCREKLYISFDEIGWGDWIIQPRGYDAYFCRGSCGTVASVTQSTSHHSTFLQKVIAMNRGKGQRPLELIPCCTAKQYSSLQLVFMDSNNTATQKTFPNMVIESCGCR